jgi:chorismate dehydratase
MKKIKISAVSYLNTLPFVNGIKHSGMFENYDLQLDIPSVCARKFINNEVDIALVPVAALKKMKSYKLLNKYCIGSNGKVKTVILLSQIPLQSIRKVHLDYHSLTSVNLVKILAKSHWHISPEWINLDELTEVNMMRLESLVAIGDKTFLLEKEFKYVFDLATEWKNYTGLPFVFACWVANENVEDIVIDQFEKTLEWGVKNKQKAIENLFDKERFPYVNIEEYLEKNIDFIFDDKKHKAMNLFLSYMDAINS